MGAFCGYRLLALTVSLAVCAGCTSPKTKARSSNTNPSATNAGNLATASSNSVGAMPTSGPVTPLSGLDVAMPALTAEQKRQQERQLHRSLIGQMIDQGSWYAALAHSDAYDQQWGEDTQSRLLRAHALRLTGQLPEAEKRYAALRDTDVRAQALHGLSQIAAQRGQWKNAESLLSEAIRLQPLDARLYNDQGLVQTLLNKPQEAFSALRKSQELDPNRIQASANLALYAAVFNEEPIFKAMAAKLNWQDSDALAVRSQAARIRAAHQQGRIPNPEIFAGR